MLTMCLQMILSPASGFRRLRLCRTHGAKLCAVLTRAPVLAQPSTSDHTCSVATTSRSCLQVLASAMRTEVGLWDLATAATTSSRQSPQ